MIAPEVVDEVQRLLDAGEFSQRTIARRLSISRGTVNRIATGKRPAYATRPDEDRSARPTSPPRRCPDCGAKVYMPCRSCGTRVAMAQGRRPPILGRLMPGDEPLELDLRAEHRLRFEQIPARRPADEVPPDTGLPDDLLASDDDYALDPREVLDAFELDEETATPDPLYFEP